MHILLVGDDDVRVDLRRHDVTVAGPPVADAQGVRILALLATARGTVVTRPTRPQVRSRLDQTDLVLARSSRSSIAKTGYVQKELRRALDRADEQPEGMIYLVPVRLEPCDVPERLAHLHRVDLFTPGATAGCSARCAALRRHGPAPLRRPGRRPGATWRSGGTAVPSAGSGR